MRGWQRGAAIFLELSPGGSSSPQAVAFQLVSARLGFANKLLQPHLEHIGRKRTRSARFLLETTSNRRIGLLAERRSRENHGASENSESNAFVRRR